VTAEPADGEDASRAATGDPVAALDDMLLGPRRYTEADVVDEAGTDRDTADGLWRAMGFPSAEPGERAFTEADVDALREAAAAAALVSDDVVVASTRAMGRALSRLAEAEVEIVAEALTGAAGGEPTSAPGGPEQAAATVLDVLRDRLPGLDRVMIYVWHRHLAAATARALAAPREDGAGCTVGFADLVGFTERVRDLDEDRLADLVGSFERVTSDIVTGLGGRVVKTIGDEVLFEADSPAIGAEIALRLAERHATDPGLPDVRVGMSTGNVLARFGDVFGPVVNVAARLTALARPGTVLVDRAAARALDGDPAYRIRRLRPARVRGYHHLEASLLRRSET
jgi:adenylate cyclase